jgi:START domain
MFFIKYIFCFLLLANPFVELFSLDHSKAKNSKNNNGKDWKLAKDQDGIKVYYRKIEGKNLNEIKIQSVFNCNLSTLVAALGDVPKYKEWVYATKEAKTLKRISNREVIYYDLIDFPWPLTNRDLVIHAKVQQNLDNKVVRVNLSAQKDMFPEQKGIVRIQLFKAEWVLTPLKDKVQVDYILSSDPAGMLPDQVVNLALDEGPVKTMQSLKKMISKGGYNNINEAKILN